MWRFVANFFNKTLLPSLFTFEVNRGSISQQESWLRGPRKAIVSITACSAESYHFMIDRAAKHASFFLISLCSYASLIGISTPH